MNEVAAVDAVFAGDQYVLVAGDATDELVVGVPLPFDAMGVAMALVTCIWGSVCLGRDRCRWTIV